MQHLLVTRYNLQTAYGNEAGVDPLSDEWLDHRELLFRTYCMPSVVAQSCKEFEWFLCIHPDTPKRYFDYLDGIATVILAPDAEQAMNLIRRRVGEGVVITTRMDNDDAIAGDFIKRLQAEAVDHQGSAPFIIDFRNSARHSVDLNAWQLYRWHKTSSFISLVDNVARPDQWRRWVYSYSHNMVDEHFPVFMVDTDEPMTLAVVHDRNIDNPWPKNRPDAGDLSSRFNTNQQLKRTNFKTIR